MRPFASVSVTALALLGFAPSAPAQLGSEFRANTYTTGAQRHAALAAPAVAAAADGSFVVVWRDYTAGSSIAGRRYSSTGAPLGSEFRVNTTTTGGSDHPAVAYTAANAFVVAWDQSQYGESETLAQRYDAAGAKLGAEFRVNT